MAGPDDPIYRAKLSPHRSLTRRQARGIIVATGCALTLLGVPFYLLGAWPVAGFFGLDAAALALAFALSFRSARAYEALVLTSLELLLAKVSAGGARREWRFNPLWVRLIRREDEEFGLLGLSLASRGRQVEVGGFLGPDARAAVARDLSRALAEARRGPQFPLD
jgi:uncharacterized membrane protein